MEKGTLLDRVGAEDRDRPLLAKALDRAERARGRNVPAASDFLSPRQINLARDLLRLADFPEEDCLFTGGYDGAERQVILFLPDWLDRDSLSAALGLTGGTGVPAGEDTAELNWQEDYGDVVPIRFLRASYRKEDGVTHRDLLGSLMGLGVKRETVGDILAGEDSADLAVLDTVAPFLLQNWELAGHAKLHVAAVSPSRLHIPALRCKEYRDTVSSLRLDAVLSTGFRMGRGRAAELVEAGRVQVDWRECAKPDRVLSPGCTVTARGLGKMELLEVGPPTRKGRFPVTIRRYL